MTVPILVIVGIDLPDALADPFLRSGQLIRVLERWCAAVDGLFLRHAGHRPTPAALRALIDMIRLAPHPAGSPCAMPGQIGPVA